VKAAGNSQTNREQPWLGMTVVELLIFVAALAVVILLAVPGSSMLVEHYRLKSASSSLVEGLNLARGEALKRASTVRVCPSSNGRFCRADGDWAQVWSTPTATVTAWSRYELIKAFAGPNEVCRSFAAPREERGVHGDRAMPPTVRQGEFGACHTGSKRDARPPSMPRVSQTLFPHLGAG
jgi:Tfp pilus assembly protein PilE